jgi:GntR family transcriptional regulator
MHLTEVDAPRDVAEALGANRVLLHHYKSLRNGEPVGLTWSYYPLSLPGGASLADRVEPADDATAVLARIGCPARECADEITTRPPTGEEADGLDLPPSAHVIRQFREIYAGDLRPVAVSVIIKPGHLCEFEYSGKIPSYPAESLEIEE